MRLLSLIALSVLTATPLTAQLRPADPFGAGATTMARRALHGSPDALLDAPIAADQPSATLTSAEPRATPFGIRLLIGAVGTGAGAVAGGVAGYHLLPRRDCGDDQGLCEGLIGAAIGAVAGAALGAALPRGGGSCTFDRRLGTGLLGAAAGGLAGLLIGRGKGSMVVYTVPIGTMIGAAIGADHC